jgi:streptomycin 6-kinase
MQYICRMHDPSGPPPDLTPFPHFLLSLYRMLQAADVRPTELYFPHLSRGLYVTVN